jgi:hypothetical protein
VTGHRSLFQALALSNGGHFSSLGYSLVQRSTGAIDYWLRLASLLKPSWIQTCLFTMAAGERTVDLIFGCVFGISIAVALIVWIGPCHY